MGEEEKLKEGIEEIAVELGKFMEGASFLLGYDEMLELALKAIMNELRIPNEGKFDVVKKAALGFD